MLALRRYDFLFSHVHAGHHGEDDRGAIDRKLTALLGEQALD